MALFGGIETGGTKHICIIGTGPKDIIAETRIATTTPKETLPQVIKFFEPFLSKKELTAVGIGSFGPLDLNPDSKTYGYITTTPKLAWQNINLLGILQKGLNLPVTFDTDVNAAAYGEQFWSKEKQLLDPFVYMTVGTGIGVGVIINGKPIHGLIHTEVGHFAIPHDWRRDPFPGVCPFHGDCLEGLATGPSMLKRWGQTPDTLPDDHPGWDLEAEYIAYAMVNMIYAYSPKQIILGGGVSQRNGLIEKVRQKVQKIANGYVHSSRLQEDIESYIHLPMLGIRSGALGAMTMAMKRFEQK